MNIVMASQSRPIAASHGPDIWGDKFTSIPRDFELWEAYSKERDRLKNEARRMLVPARGEWTDKLILINTIERLGVGYHFAEEIEDMLAKMHNAHATLESYEKYDLFTTALFFRILRQHGYKVTSEIFNKYKEIDGKFSEAITRDPEGLLSLYDAAHLRTHGEAVLDEALDFTTYHLKSVAKSLDSDSLAKQVKHALEQPLHKGITRMEAKHFILYYEENPLRNDVLLKFAKLDFNLLQMLYKQELSQVISWWADIDVESKLPEFRSRVVEGYVLSMANIFEPCYALARIMFTKMILAVSITDDLYDAYGTMDELNIYTKAIERFDADCIEGLPGNSTICYSTCVKLFREFDEEIVKQGSYYDVSYCKEAFKTSVLAYHQEAVWRDKNYVPPLKEYLMNGSLSSCICPLGLSSILGMGHADTVEACKWAMKRPRAVFAAENMGRIINDIVGYEIVRYIVMGSQSRPIAASYGPDIWGDKFTSIPRDFELWEAYSKERDMLKNEARRMLVPARGEWTDKLILINTIERLGVGYHFAEEIEDMLAKMHNAHAKLESYEKYDLFTTALFFRILRQHGHKVTSEIFNHYKEIDGKFSEAITRDPEGLLSLYDAAHLRTHGDAVLDEALDFTTYHLKSVAKSLDSDSLAKQVKHALEQPLHRGITRMEAKHFILYYEENPLRNDVLLKFAKLDFNLLQMLYKQELSQVISWWADTDVESKLPEFRSRVVEGYVWAVANTFEPCYALARIMLTKMILVVSVSDDLYDAYGTMDELNTYTKAIERLDADCIKGLPGNSKICYSTCVKFFREFDEEVVKQGSYYDVSYCKEAFKTSVLAYHQEAVWRDKNYVPPLKEYLMNGSISSNICPLGLSSILGMGHADTIEACKWAANEAKAVLAAEKMGRIINDIVGYEEEHSRPHVATSIDCYMKEYGVSKEEAVVKLYEMIEDTWKDINEEFLRPTTVGSHYINIFLNWMRVCDVTYKNRDGYTHPDTMKDEIEFLLMDPIPM